MAAKRGLMIKKDTEKIDDEIPKFQEGCCRENRRGRL